MNEASKAQRLSKVYLDAAIVMEKSYSPNGNHTFACWAIEDACIDAWGTGLTARALAMFAEYFKPIGSGSSSVAWFGLAAQPSQSTPERLKMRENKDHRVTALLFMHEIAKG